MTWEHLLQKKEQFSKIRDILPREALESFDRSFDIEYAHNSTAIEGNTLTLIQTKAILEDGLSVGGKTIRELYEAANHAKAFTYVKKRVAEGKPLDESSMKDIPFAEMIAALEEARLDEYLSINPEPAAE